jgi:uncharacterized membrane protein YkoI
LKVTKHNVLAVACATLLLTAVLTPAQTNARDKEPRGPRYAQSETATDTQGNDRKKVQRTRYAQNDDTNTQYNSKEKGKRSSRSSDSQSSAAANDGNNGQDKNEQKNQRTPRSSDSQSEAPTVSRSEAASIAERATGGRVLSVRESGRYWQVKVLVDDKRVRVVSVDMRSGRVR